MSLLQYNFLILSCLFLIPGIIIFIIRKDLRKPIYLMSITAIPFSFTEYLFYPDYWEPNFLWDLIDILGFGIEDIIFVIGLASFSSTAYCFTFQKRFSSTNSNRFIETIQRIVLQLGLAFVLLLIVIYMNIPIIYGSIAIMILLSVNIFSKRKDLILPGLLGGLVSCLIYTVLCVLLIFIYPEIFEITWHTEKFLNIYIYGLPFEEILYGYSSGFIATIFYPFVTNSYFTNKTIIS